MKKLIVVLSLILPVANAQARNCSNKAKHEGIAQLEDEFDLTCEQNTATVLSFPQGQTDLTRFEVNVICGGKNSLAVILLKPDCFDASANEIHNLYYGKL